MTGPRSQTAVDRNGYKGCEQTGLSRAPWAPAYQLCH